MAEMIFQTRSDISCTHCYGMTFKIYFSSFFHVKNADFILYREESPLRSPKGKHDNDHGIAGLYWK